MGTLKLRFYRYKLNQVDCTCGLLKWFSQGMDARFFADNHAKEHNIAGDPVELLAYNEDEPIMEARTAKPGRHAGGVVHQNLY